MIFEDECVVLLGGDEYVFGEFCLEFVGVFFGGVGYCDCVLFFDVVNLYEYCGFVVEVGGFVGFCEVVDYGGDVVE